jgi:hypothetical protein
MKLPIYQSEIDAGLQDLISQNSIACYATIQKSESDALFSKLKDLELEKLGIAVAENKDQFDLFYLNTILVSTGWNKNDDVFDPTELWRAKSTSEDKPFNFMHDESDIIGHITANQVVDFTGNNVPEDVEEIPEKFEILTSAVIYKEWSDPEKKSRIQDIITEIEAGEKWAVSMECLFPNFDYAMQDSEGSTKVVTRDESSAFLTKHLRAYGGTGQYDDFKIGRLLRQLSFSGKGLVSNPANPRSVIINQKNLDFKVSEAQNYSISSLKEQDTMTPTEKQFDELQKELAEAKAANKELTEKVLAEQKAEFESKIQTLADEAAHSKEALTQSEAKATEAEANVQTLTDSISDLEATIATKDEEMKKKLEELRDMKKKEAMMKRKAEIAEIGYEGEEAEAFMTEFADVEDDTFNKVLALMKKKAVKKPEETEETEAEETESGEIDPSGETTASNVDLDNLADQETSSANDHGQTSDPSAQLRTVASEWMNSFLNKNNK